MTTSRSPLLFRYPGGKHYAIDLLRPFWEMIPHDEYREPFAGGASVFFNKQKAKKNWLNDIDSELITTFMAVADDKQRRALLKRFATETASPTRWKQIRDMDATTPIDIAFKYFYMNRTSFSGKLISPAWGYRPKRSLPPERWHERLTVCSDKLRGVKFTCTDFQRVISRRSAGSVLMYVDPPYFAPPRKKHYRHGLAHDDHVRLADALKATTHSFFLTYDDVPEVRSLYAWAHVYPVNFVYRVDNSRMFGNARRQGFELVITNYEVPRLEKA